MNFKIGQKVVCIDASYGNVSNSLVVGQIYTVLKKAACPICNTPLVDVGVIAKHPNSFCMNCEGEYKNGGIWYFRTERFAPVEERGDTTIEEFMQVYMNVA